MKYLIWAVILYFAWRWYLASKETASSDDDGRAAGPTSGAASAAAGEGAVEKMVACAHCGIHLPLSEALTGADHRHYCCEEHRALHAAS
ncbi:MAG: hypothetical protein RL404_1578 [Pseudomonadota bacterium]